MSTVEYRRIPHAAHYAHGHPAVGHDLEQWDAEQAFSAPYPDGVPHDAEKHSGYVSRDGTAHTVFVRRAPLSDVSCVICDRRGDKTSTHGDVQS